MDEDLEVIASWLRDARQIVVLTGAGLSTESGIPDFRGPQGVWTTNPGAERTSDIRHYVSDVEIRKQAWRTRLTSPMWEATPNAAHRALVTLEQRATLHTLVTQNIDGLHRRAGTDPAKLVEIHGNALGTRCLHCTWHGSMAETLERVRAGDEDPACPACGGILKSTTISFGESLDPDDLRRAQHAADGADLFLALGTSLTVTPASALPQIALRAGARLLIANEEPTPFDAAATAVRRDRLGDLLPALVELV